MSERNQDQSPEALSAAHADLLLVERVLGGETNAFEELVRRHEKRVYRTTLAITKNEHDAEEALQETFIKAYKNLSTFRRESRFTTWLTRIAINQGLQILRARRPTVSVEEQQEQGGLALPTRVEDWYSNPELRYARKQLQEIVEEAIQSLPDIYRVVFVMRDVQGEGTRETADALGIAIPAAKSRLLRARLMVREALSQRLARPATMKSQMMHLMLVMRDALSAKFGKVHGGSNV